MRTLYLDESGDPNPRAVDPLYPVFVLGGVVMDDVYAETIARNALNSVKREIFGRDDFLLHSSEISRRDGIYATLLDTPRRERFYARLNETMRQLDYQVVARFINKERQPAEQIPQRQDLYMSILSVLVSQFVDLIGPHGNSGRIVAEQRDRALDREVMREWWAIRRRGTGRASGGAVRSRIRSLTFASKADRVTGIELADLVLSPIGRHAIGKRVYEDWEVVSSKVAHRPEPSTRDFEMRTLS